MDIEKTAGATPVASPAKGRVLEVQVVESPDDSGCWNRTTRVLKQMYALLASHIGLGIIMALYSFAGAFVFSKIEQPHERRGKEAVVFARQYFMALLANDSSALWRINETTFSEMLDAELQVYEDAVRDSYDKGISTSTAEIIWDYWGAMFFCITTYTTIGKIRTVK